MESLALTLILASAAAHAMWNYAAKGTKDKDSYMFLMNLTSQLTFLPAMVILVKDWSFPVGLVPVLVLSAAAEAIYYLALSRAYDAGDLSIVYPVARSSPLFLVVIGVVIFSEKISPVGVLGIIVMVVGVYVINMNDLNAGSLKNLLASIRQPALFFALLAALATTAYTLCDRFGVSVVDPFRYDFWLEIFVTAALAPIIAIRGGLGLVRAEWSRSSLRAMASGVLMRGGYILVLLAMGMAPVSYLLSIRQVSVVLGAIIGVMKLGESYGKTRILGSLVVFVGVYLLAVFA